MKKYVFPKYGIIFDTTKPVSNISKLQNIINNLSYFVIWRRNEELFYSYEEELNKKNENGIDVINTSKKYCKGGYNLLAACTCKNNNIIFDVRQHKNYNKNIVAAHLFLKDDTALKIWLGKQNYNNFLAEILTNKI